MLYVQMSRLDEMFESFGADTGLQYGITIS
jgi:hypothetical protein